MGERGPRDRDLQGRDPFENLGDLIDGPVSPRAAFADELRSRLTHELSAGHGPEEHIPSMDARIAPRPVAIPLDRVRQIRPTVILELAALAVVILGLVAALNRGWLQSDPEPPTVVPAAILQDDTTTPETQPEQTATALPTVAPPTEVPDGAPERTSTALPVGTMEPTVVPPGNIPNTIWALPLADGESVDFGGLIVDDDTVYRLLATPSFVGVQAIDAERGTIRWQQSHDWAGTLFAHDDDLLYIDGGDSTLVAIDADTGNERWRAQLDGNPIALDEDDGDDDQDRIFVLLDTDVVVALSEDSGAQLWTAQGPASESVTVGSTSLAGTGAIASEDNTVAAMSSAGVLAGFDAATGDLRWSIDGYDAASAVLWTEDDRLIVRVGGLPGAFGAGSSDDESGTDDDVLSVVVPALSQGCQDAFVPAGELAPAAGTAATAETDATVADGAAADFRVQAIDPATGNVLWARQSSTATLDAGATMVCSIDLETGAVSTGTGTAKPVAIGFGAGDDALESAGIEVFGQTPLALVTDDGSIFAQLTDGTLVKVALGQTVVDDDLAEDRDDDDDSESSDD